MKGTKELKKGSDNDSIVTDKQVVFMEKLDKIYDAFLSNRKMLSLSDRDYSFARDLLDIHHILVAPDITRAKELVLIKQLLKCSDTKAKRLREAHFLLWGDAKQSNIEFKKRIICDKILKFAEEAEKKGYNEQVAESEKKGYKEQAAELYEKYYHMMGFDKMEKVKTPRSLPKVVVLKNKKELLEIEDAEIDE